MQTLSEVFTTYQEDVRQRILKRFREFAGTPAVPESSALEVRSLWAHCRSCRFRAGLQHLTKRSRHLGGVGFSWPFEAHRAVDQAVGAPRLDPPCVRMGRWLLAILATAHAAEVSESMQQEGIMKLLSPGGSQAGA